MVHSISGERKESVTMVKEQHRQIGEFERQATEYARQWATGLNRRDLLKAFGVAGGAALLTPAAMAAAPHGGIISRSGRLQEGSILKIARGQASDTLDPHQTTLLVAHEICWQIYDSLIYLDEAGTVYPGAATEWAFSDDNLTLTFKLREGVLFHDGTPLDAQIVKDTVARMIDPATASPNVGMLGPLDVVEVIDPLTVAYKFTEPFAPIFVGLGYSYCAPISIPAVAKFGDQFGRNPVGTGPYKFVAWNADDSIVLEKNPEHTWSTTFYKTQQAPQIDRVEFLVIPEDATRLSALSSGEVDVVAGTDAVPTDKITALQSESGIKVVTRPTVGLNFLNFNHKVKPFDDVRVRQAISYAIDRESIVGLVLDGQGKPAISLLASAFGDYNPDVEPYAYDPEKAKALLAEAGLADGFETTYLTIAPPALFTRVAEVIQENLAAINVTIEIQGFPVAQWSGEGNSGKYGIIFSGYTYSDPDVLYLLAHSGAFFNFAWPTGLESDPALTFDDELDALLDQQRVTLDKAARRDLLFKAQDRLNDQAHYFPLWEGVYAAAMKEDVQGLDIDLVGFIHLQELSRTA
jgi:peptide/nickel transport system substrate-binding protein